MRVSLALGPAVILTLTACGNDTGATTDSVADDVVVSAEEVVERAQDLPKPQQGQYRSRVEYLSVVAPEAEPERLEAVRSAMKAQSESHEYCMTQAEADLGWGNLAQRSQAESCTMERFDTSGGKLDASMSCKNVPGSPTKVTIKGTGTATASEMNFMLEGMAPGIGPSTIHMRVTNERIGDCPGGRHAVQEREIDHWHCIRMATRPFLDMAAMHRQELARRWALAREPDPDNARGPRAALLLGELGWVAEPVRRAIRKGGQPLAIAHDPRTVMLLPGFGAHPLRMRYMARQLEMAGHTVKRWGPGFNLGATLERFAQVEERLLAIHRRASEPVYLIGWSLGGVMARELAKVHPQAVAKVITMGSPFSGNPRANNGWRAYQAIAGHRVDEPQWEARPAEKPPVETVALWSARDGVVHPRCACGRPGERDRAIALRCTHMGFVQSPEVVQVLLRELDAG